MYDYEKVECFMQGVRDYLKFLKEVLGEQITWLGLILEIKRMTRDEGIKLMKKFDGKRPYSLDLFLDFLI